MAIRSNDPDEPEVKVSLRAAAHEEVVLPPFIITVSYPDNAVAFIDLLPDGQTKVTRVAVAGGPIGLAVHPGGSLPTSSALMPAPSP